MRTFELSSRVMFISVLIYVATLANIRAFQSRFWRNPSSRFVIDINPHRRSASAVC